MRALLNLPLWAILLIPPPVAAQEPPAGYSLVWADEFAVNGFPDDAGWTHDTSANRTGWYNNERQYYAAPMRRPDRAENARVENGHLVIEARRETLDAAGPPPDWGGQAYTSARLVSRAAWTYGFYEISARLPCGRGTWPAIWMLPRDLVDWPLDGEIDIMEHVGHRPGVVHTGAYNHVAGTQRGAEIAVPDACETFHRYQTRWTPQAIVFLIDDREFYRFANDGAGDKTTWPFDEPFELIVNIAVGGDWGGAEGIDDAALPQLMEIDYVRVSARRRLTRRVHHFRERPVKCGAARLA